MSHSPARDLLLNVAQVDRQQLAQFNKFVKKNRVKDKLQRQKFRSLFLETPLGHVFKTGRSAAVTTACIQDIPEPLVLKRKELKKKEREKNQNVDLSLESLF